MSNATEPASQPLSPLARFQNFRKQLQKCPEGGPPVNELEHADLMLQLIDFPNTEETTDEMVLIQLHDAVGGALRESNHALDAADKFRIAAVYFTESYVTGSYSKEAEAWLVSFKEKAQTLRDKLNEALGPVDVIDKYFCQAAACTGEVDPDFTGDWAASQPESAFATSEAPTVQMGEVDRDFAGYSADKTFESPSDMGHPHQPKRHFGMGCRL